MMPSKVSVEGQTEVDVEKVLINFLKFCDAPDVYKDVCFKGQCRSIFKAMARVGLGVMKIKLIGDEQKKEAFGKMLKEELTEVLDHEFAIGEE